jgi:UPF0716 protein FxsA
MWLKLAFLVVPLIEIALYVLIGRVIGVWLTLAWVVLSAVLGIFILKRAARFGTITFDGSMQALGQPSSPPAQRVMQILAGVLLILPGFLTDSLGLLLLLPPVQLAIIGLLAARIATFRASGHQGMTVEGDWREVEPGPDGRLNSSDPAGPPSEWTRH